MAEERRKQQQNIPFPDRRRDSMTCDNHERLTERISTLEKEAGVSSQVRGDHESRISDLYDKHEMMMSKMSEIVRSIDRLDHSLNNGWVARFDKMQESIERLEGIVKQNYEMYKESCKKYDQFSRETKAHFDELDKFAWFRKSINKFRDSWFFSAIKIAFYVALVLGAMNWAKLGLGKFITG